MGTSAVVEARRQNDPVRGHTLSPQNQLRLIKAYASLPDALRKNYDLVLVGPRGWNDEEIVTRSRETPGVSWRSYVPDEEYSALLSKAVVLAFLLSTRALGCPYSMRCSGAFPS